MKKLYIGITSGTILFIIFLLNQNNFAQEQKNDINKLKANINKEIKILRNENTNKDELIRANNEAMHNLEQKVRDMEKYINESHKYIEASQKNLDLWLKYLAFTLSILIGYSIFTGIRTHERAKDELDKLKAIGEEIKTSSRNAKIKLRKLNKVSELITEVENTAKNTKKLESEATQKLNEFANKETISLNDLQIKAIDETINKTKDELQKGGIEAFKNLYFGKALKAVSEKKWDEVIRLLTAYIDLDDSNIRAFLHRAYAFVNLSKFDNALADYNEAIKIDHESYKAYNNRGTTYLRMKKYDKAILDYTESIRINPEYALAYSNRADAHSSMGNTVAAEQDLEIAKKINLEKNT